MEVKKKVKKSRIELTRKYDEIVYNLVSGRSFNFQENLTQLLVIHMGFLKVRALC